MQLNKWGTSCRSITESRQLEESALVQEFTVTGAVTVLSNEVWIAWSVLLLMFDSNCTMV